LNYLDYVIIVVVAIGFLLGFKDGLVRKIIGLIGLIAGVVLAFEFSGSLGKLITSFFNHDEYLAIIISGILIFLIIVLIASIIKRIVHPLDKVNKLLNQFLGGVVGTLQIMFFLSGIFLFLDIFSFPAKEVRNESFSFNKIHDIIPSAFDLILGHKSKASDMIKTFIESKDSSTTVVPKDTIPEKTK